MVSGRGLGHTGGTLDKLEAIPGFRTDLSIADFARIVRDVGTCMIGQTKEIAPADKVIYGLRDVTATVESIPLIVASILSKKLAEGIDGLVLDVKVGKGAFMKSEAAARELASRLVSVGTRAGKKVVAVLTRMDAPLGKTIGNANETREALEVLHGKGPADLVECTLVLGAEMLVLGGKAENANDARAKMKNALETGAAIRTMEKMIEAQHGDPSVAAHPEKLVNAKEVIAIKANKSGFVTGIDALTLGLAGVRMGAGRERSKDPVLHDVGIELEKKPGDKGVEAGEIVAKIFVRDRSLEGELTERCESAFTYGDAAPAEAPLVVDRMRRVSARSTGRSNLEPWGTGKGTYSGMVSHPSALLTEANGISASPFCRASFREDTRIGLRDDGPEPRRRCSRSPRSRRQRCSCRRCPLRSPRAARAPRPRADARTVPRGRRSRSRHLRQLLQTAQVAEERRSGEELLDRHRGAYRAPRASATQGAPHPPARRRRRSSPTSHRRTTASITTAARRCGGLFEILDELDAQSRLVFTLRFLEEMELMEVAVAVGESLASVKRRLARVVLVIHARAAQDSALAPYLQEQSDV